jgi:hypothetical protein
VKKPSSLFLCLLTVLVGSTFGQKSVIPPVHYAAGTVLVFHLQTRLNPGHSNETDGLPKGTVIRVKILQPIDSTSESDGADFHGEVAAAVASQNGVVIHAGSEVSGILALLRNRRHPNGFRYELLITGVKDHSRNYDLTASLSPSVFEAPAGTPAAAAGETEKAPANAGATKVPAPSSN